MLVQHKAESIHFTTVGRFLVRLDLKPHRIDGWMNRKAEPHFEERAAEIKDLVVEATAGEPRIELKAAEGLPSHLTEQQGASNPQAARAQTLLDAPPPPERVVVSFDEKTGMQATERIAPNKPIVFHFTPKHASWLNPIECWFGVLVRKVLRRRSFLSTEELQARVQRFITYYNEKMAHPYRFKRWKTRGADSAQRETARQDSQRLAS